MGNMQSELNKWKKATGYKQTNVKTSSSKRKSNSMKARKETFSTRELEEMMGMRNPTFERRRGALRQR